MLISEYDKLFHQALDSLAISTLYRGGTSHLLMSRTVSPLTSWQSRRFCQDVALKMLKIDNDMKIIAKTIDKSHFIDYYYLVDNDKCHL